MNGVVGLAARRRAGHAALRDLFHTQDHSSLAAEIGYAVHLAQRGQAARRADVRLTATVLADALEDLATILDQRFLHTNGTPAEAFAAYAADHGRAVTGS